MIKRARKIAGVLMVFSALCFIAVIGVLKNKYIPPILMYHNIDNRYKDSKLSVSPKSFEREMAFIAKNYTPLSLYRIAEMVRNGEPIPPDAIAVTFDDGYSNNYYAAFPLLKKYNVPATIFLILNQLGKEGYLAREQIIEMHKSGLVDFGSHTITHPDLTGIELERAGEEISLSKQKLEQIFGWKFKMLSYPGGSFNAKIEALVRKAGYYGAVATDPGEHFRNNDIFALKRVRISRTSDNILVFWLYSSGEYSWIKEIRDQD